MPSVDPMTVRVLFFSTLRDLAGKSETELELPDGADVGNLLDSLDGKVPGFSEWSGRVLVAVDHEYAEKGQPLAEGQEVAVMPPVQGG